MPNNFNQGESAATQWINQSAILHPLNLLSGKCPDAPYFIILLCVKPDDFTCQENNTASLNGLIKALFWKLSSLLYCLFSL
jgi:hypothetical protein